MKKKIYFTVVLFVLSLIIAGSAVALSIPDTKKVESIENIQELGEYVASVKAHSNTVVKLEDDIDVPVTVTFSEKMGFEEVKNLVTQYGVEGVSLECRAVMADGTRITIFTDLRRGVDIAEENVMVALKNNTSCEFQGIIGMRAMVPSAKLIEIQNETNVYLVDASKVVLSNNKNMMDDNAIKVENGSFPKSIAWELEDLGIIK